MDIPLSIIRQCAVELLAHAMLDLFPGALLAGGEVSDIGFHYDFQLKQPVDVSMFPLIEEKMRGQAKSDVPIQTLDMMRENAAQLFLHHKQPLIAALVEDSPENIVQIFKMGSFHDFCPTPYGKTSKEAGVFKLLKMTSLENGIRIEGTAFANSYDLKKFLKKRELALKCDHRLLGPEMNLFIPYGEGWIWLPKGAFIREFLLDFWRQEHKLQGFEGIASPTEEHPEIEQFHAIAYQSKLRYEKDLPIRYSEVKEVFDENNSQKSWGLFCNEVFTRDIQNIFCTSDQVLGELISSLQFIMKTINIFGFEPHWYLCIKGKKLKGTKELWNINVQRLEAALEHCQIKYIEDHAQSNSDGPQIEVRFEDALGREWLGSQVGVNFTCTSQFNLNYRQNDGKLQVPVMVTRSIFGSLERFIALLVEQNMGMMPLWLAPEQIRVVSVGEQTKEYAEAVRNQIVQEKWRVGIDIRNEPLGNKIHAAERERIPHVLIVGDKEQKKHLVSVRSYGQETEKTETQVETFLTLLKKKSNELGSTKSVES